MGKPHHTSPPVTEHALSSLSDAYGQAGLGPEDLDYYSTSDWFENLAANCLQPAERAVVFACGEVVLPMRIGQAALGPLRGVAAQACQISTAAGLRRRAWSRALTHLAGSQR